MLGCAQASPVTPVCVTRASEMGSLGMPPGETLIWRILPVKVYVLTASSKFRQPGLNGFVEPQLTFLDQSIAATAEISFVIEAAQKTVSRFMGGASAEGLP